MGGQKHLLEITQTLGAVGFFLGLTQGGQEHTGQYGDDGYDHQQLDECEGFACFIRPDKTRQRTTGRLFHFSAHGRFSYMKRTGLHQADSFCPLLATLN